jgi:hypothetical protein
VGVAPQLKFNSVVAIVYNPYGFVPVTKEVVLATLVSSNSLIAP